MDRLSLGACRPKVVFANHTDIRALLWEHCTEVVVVSHNERITIVDGGPLFVKIFFHDFSWIDPHGDGYFAAMLMRYLLYIRYIVEDRCIRMTQKEADGLHVRIAEEAKALAPSFPRIAAVFEELYGIDFANMAQGRYPRKRC